MSNEFAFLEEERDEARAERDRLQAQIALKDVALQRFIAVMPSGFPHLEDAAHNASALLATSNGEDYHNPADVERIRELEEALQPLAKCKMPTKDEGRPDDERVTCYILMGEIRKAYDLLHK